MTAKPKSCGVALPIERNCATFDIKTATVGATTTQPISLKSLASKVLQRNQERNSPATGQEIDRNFSPENGPQKLRVADPAEKEKSESCGVAITTMRNSATSDGETPAPCCSCNRLELVEILGRMVAGCHYRAQEPYPDGWRRLPADLNACFWN